MAESADVSPGDVVLASDHNEVRDDILDATLGHKHTIATDDGAPLQWISGTMRNYWNGVCDKNNLTVSVNAASAFTHPAGWYSLLSAGAGAGSYCNLKDNFVFSGVDDLDMDDYLDLIVGAQTTITTIQDVFMGSADFTPAAVTPANHVSIVRHLGFFIEDGTLWASNADGTTQTATDISAGITVTNKHTYRVIRDTSEIRFYVDNVLKATHSTNLPTSNSHKLFIGITAATGGTRVLYLYDVYYTTTNFGG